MEMTLLFMLILTILPVQASSLYCFEGEKLHEVVNYLKPILKNEDTVDYLHAKNCLSLGISPSRFILFDRWLGRRYKFRKSVAIMSSKDSKKMTISSYSQNHCRLELIKKEKIRLNKVRAQAGRKVRALQTKSLQEKVSRSQLLVSLGSQVKQVVNDQEVYIRCSQRGKSSYQLDLSLTSLRGGLSTSITVDGAHEVNIGELVQNLKQEKLKLATGKGLTIDRNTSENKASYFIKVK